MSALGVRCDSARTSRSTVPGDQSRRVSLSARRLSSARLLNLPRANNLGNTNRFAPEGKNFLNLISQLLPIRKADY